MQCLSHDFLSWPSSAPHSHSSIWQLQVWICPPAAHSRRGNPSQSTGLLFEREEANIVGGHCISESLPATKEALILPKCISPFVPLVSFFCFACECSCTQNFKEVLWSPFPKVNSNSCSVSFSASWKQGERTFINHQKDIHRQSHVLPKLNRHTSTKKFRPLTTLPMWNLFSNKPPTQTSNMDAWFCALQTVNFEHSSFLPSSPSVCTLQWKQAA